jgi:hypothetical protein
MAALCSTLAERITSSNELGRRILDWPGDPTGGGDALPMRVAGALHALVREGKAPELAGCYPPNPPPSPASLWKALEPVLGRPELLPWLDSPPQTNEVGRSAVLMSGLLCIAERLPQPVELLELGASAGLNLNLGRYFHRLGGREAGDPASPVKLGPRWAGPPPPGTEVEVVARRGVDLNPLDPRRDGERLLAFVWPDQSERLERLEAALALAAGDPPKVDEGDAADWLEARLGEPANPGTTRVVLHSVAFQYFPPPVQARVSGAIEAAAPSGPIAWLRFEKLPDEKDYSLRLRKWPGGEDRLLARAHPHGSWVEWLG